MRLKQKIDRRNRHPALVALVGTCLHLSLPASELTETTNLLVNGSFEAGNAGWMLPANTASIIDGDPAKTPDQVSDGTKALSFSAGWFEQVIDLVPGRTYVLSFDARAAKPITGWYGAGLKINGKDEGPTFQFSQRSSFQRFTRTFTVPAGKSKASLWFFGPDNGNSLIYVDNIRLQPGPKWAKDAAIQVMPSADNRSAAISWPALVGGDDKYIVRLDGAIKHEGAHRENLTISGLEPGQSCYFTVEPFIGGKVQNSVLRRFFLVPGGPVNATATVAIDVTSVLNRTTEQTPKPYGVNLNFLFDKNANLQSQFGARPLQEALFDLGGDIVIRYPGGEKSDNALINTPMTNADGSWQRGADGKLVFPTEGPLKVTAFGNYATRSQETELLGLDEYIEYCREVGAVPYVTLAFTPLWGYPANHGDTMTAQDLIDHAVSVVRYANKVKGYQIRYWGIGNENMNYPKTFKNANLPEMITRFADALKAEDPEIIVGGDLADTQKTLAYIKQNYLDQGKKSPLDFVEFLSYPCWEWFSYNYITNNEMVTEADGNTAIRTDAVAGGIELKDGALDRIKLFDLNNGTNLSKEMKFVVAEVNSTDWKVLGGSGWPSKDNLGHALVNFELAGRFLEEPRILFSNFWNTRFWDENWKKQDSRRNSNMDFLNEKNLLVPSANALQAWGKNSYDLIVKASSSDSKRVRSFASVDSATGDMAIFLYNKGYTPYTVSFQIDGTQSAFAQKHIQVFQSSGNVVDGNLADDPNPVWSYAGPEPISSGKIAPISLPPVSLTIVNLNVPSDSSTLRRAISEANALLQSLKTSKKSLEIRVLASFERQIGYARQELERKEVSQAKMNAATSKLRRDMASMLRISQ